MSKTDFEKILPVLIERTIKILRARGLLPPEPPELSCAPFAVDQQIFERTGRFPSGLDTKEKWDASGRPYLRGPPTRVMDKLT